MKKVTIQDIADELGISRNTVSKAINNAEGLADATRERILKKAIEMGYKQFSYIKAHSSVIPEQEAQNKGEIALLCGGVIAPAHFATLMLDKLKRDLPQFFRKLSIGHGSGTLLLKHLPQRFQFLNVNTQQIHDLTVIVMSSLHFFQNFKLVFYLLFFSRFLFRFLFQKLRIVAHVFSLPCLA